MYISTKGRYGIRALLDLAVNSSDTSVIPLSSIAERQGISEGYLEQIMSTLRKANIVTSIKGSQGGYKVARETNKITAEEILEALEGTLFTIKEINSDMQTAIDMESCINELVWQPISSGISSAAASVTLADMAEAYHYKISSGSPMYYI